MSIYKYEEAIVTKMREITGDDRIIITPSEAIQNIIPRIAKDELKLPLIHIIRLPWKLAPQKSHSMKMNGVINDSFPLFREGNYVSPDDGRVHRLHVIPIIFGHTFEVWSRTREENDELLRELIWFFSTMGEFEVKIPYGVDISHKFTLSIQDDIMDNTHVINHKESGELFLQAFNTICTDAYLWKSSSHNPTCVHINTELQTEFLKHPNEIDYNKLKEEELRVRC